MADKDSKVETILSTSRTFPEFNYSGEVLKEDNERGRLRISYTKKGYCPLTEAGAEDLSVVFDMVCDPNA